MNARKRSRVKMNSQKRSEVKMNAQKRCKPLSDSIGQFAVKLAGLNAMEREKDLARQRISCAEHFGPAWPIPPKGKNVVGHPSIPPRQFTRLFYAALRENQFPLLNRLSSSTAPA
eukprot:975241-Amphidinium_carterae.1